MDAEERARKICKFLSKDGVEFLSECDGEGVIADALRSADAAAYRRGVEDAARVASNWIHPAGQEIAVRIRALVEKEDGRPADGGSIPPAGAI